jgi:signal transduction histidine kinase
MSTPLLTVALRAEHDVVVARQRARQVAKHLGFENQDQVRIATAVSEIARNVIEYAREGRVEFALEGRTPPQILSIRVTDQGPGIRELDLILSGRYQSRTGMGVGLMGARRLMDQFHIESTPERGTTILMRKLRPRQAPVLPESALGALADLIAREGIQNPLAEVQHQNQELLRALEEIRRLLGEGRQLTVALGSQCRLWADRGQLEEVVVNLALNARDAMPSGGTLTITTAEVALEHGVSGYAGVSIPGGHYGLIAVRDTGVGMDAATQAHIFEPFFTTKPVGEGTGLGLDISWRIVVKKHHGDIRVESSPGDTRFQVRLPLTPAEGEIS